MCDTVFKDSSEVPLNFDNNKADTLGGALHGSNLTFNGNTTVKFNNNEATYGGGVFSQNFTITMKNTSTVTFINNSADNGRVNFMLSLLTKNT